MKIKASQYSIYTMHDSYIKTKKKSLNLDSLRKIKFRFQTFEISMLNLIVEHLLPVFLEKNICTLYQ